MFEAVSPAEADKNAAAGQTQYAVSDYAGIIIFIGSKGNNCSYVWRFLTQTVIPFVYIAAFGAANTVYRKEI